ncbi:MAG: pilus assembly protein TadG-related protein [Actinomycetota bacterium]|nr:pilus assembly protein TadG-related protein [Actinomycetota bacterium]
MMSVRQSCESESGSTLILGIGLLGICLLALAVVTDAGNAFLQHRQLFAIADAAALAGAQAIDLPEYYANGAREATQLDAAAVIARARAHVQREQEQLSIPGLRIDSIRSNGSDVVVEVSAPVRLAFLSLVGTDVIHVSSTARLDFRAT